MKSVRFIVLFAAILLLTQSCDKSFTVFSGRDPVYYRCDLGLPPFNVVSSMGVFLSVRQSGGNVLVTDANEELSRIPMTEREAKSFLFGLGGLIIGTPALDNEKCEVFAYDLACPICDRRSIRLKFDANGVAACPNCSTTFDLNNNGFVIDSDRKDARPLYRYPVSRSGSQVIVAN